MVTLARHYLILAFQIENRRQPGHLCDGAPPSQPGLRSSSAATGHRGSAARARDTALTGPLPGRNHRCHDSWAPAQPRPSPSAAGLYHRRRRCSAQHARRPSRPSELLSNC